MTKIACLFPGDPCGGATPAADDNVLVLDVHASSEEQTASLALDSVLLLLFAVDHVPAGFLLVDHFLQLFLQNDHRKLLENYETQVEKLDHHALLCNRPGRST